MYKRAVIMNDYLLRIFHLLHEALHFQEYEYPKENTSFTPTPLIFGQFGPTTNGLMVRF
jgi:hypothetical protein